MPFSSPSVACFHPEQNKGKGWKGNKIIVIHQIYHKRHNWMENKSSLSLSHRSRKASDSLQQVTLEYLKALCRAVENHEHPPGFLSRYSMCSSTNRGWSNWARWSCASLALPRGSPRKQSSDKHNWHHAPLHCYARRDGICERCSPLQVSILSVTSVSCQASGFLGSCEHLPGEEQTFL